MSVVKVGGKHQKLQLEQPVLSTVREDVIRGVAVKCLDIKKPTEYGGSFPESN